MLELIIAVFPGILAFLIYHHPHKEQGASHRKKIVFSILFYTLICNLSVLIGLKLIGMQKFNLFEMSTRFKVKWILLELLIAIVITIIIYNLRNLSLSSCKSICKRLFPAVLFLIVTCVVFTPSSLFLENINEFMLPYSKIAPILLFFSLILAAGLYVFTLCMVNEKVLHIFIGFLFSIILCFYVQGNFLNANLPTLDGTQIDWSSSYRKETVISVSFWIICILLFLVLSCLQKAKTEQVIKYICYFLSAVQAVSLVVLLFTTKLDDTSRYAFSKEGEFTVGTQENVIIFLIDCLQASIMDDYLTSDVYENCALDDFTFFDNVTSGGAPTHFALPVLLTGMEYDPAQSFDSYLQDIHEEITLYNDFHDSGYDIRFYTKSSLLMPFLDENIVGNYELTDTQYYIGNYPDFSLQLYKLTSFYLMPQFLKHYFWLSDADLKDYIVSPNTEYAINEIKFYYDFQAAEKLQADYEKTFRFYHFNGVHHPYIMEKEAPPWEGGENFSHKEQALRGNMNIIYEYIDQLKAANIYEKSTIIILGDHGRHEQGNIEDNPAVLIKRPHETHKLTYNSAPIHFRNLTATIASCIKEDYSSYGPSVYDIAEESDVERLHTVNSSIRDRITIKQPFDDSLSSLRLITYGRSGNGEYEVWNPYKINRIDYPLGEIIDFAANNKYASQINYRLYKENGAAIASNELSMCLALENYQENDVIFHFIFSDLYNDSQKIRFYANGSKIENVICTQSDKGKEMSVIISKENITDNELVIRMVFPNAVTPNQLDRSNPDMRVLSVAFDSMWLTQ